MYGLPVLNPQSEKENITKFGWIDLRHDMQFEHFSFFACNSNSRRMRRCLIDMSK